MARARSSDVPRFDTYPAPAPSEAASTPQDWPYEPKTDEYRPGNPRLNQAAEQIGATVGRAVARARGVGDRVGVIAGGQSGPGIKEKVNELGEQARERVAELRDAAGERLEEMRDRAQRGISDAREQLSEVAERARIRASEARDQAQRYARENPLQVITGALVAGVLLGIGLRIWRASHD
ncbi:MAG TPA: hypothetical protein VL382_00845 [Terriglobales bacterium]|nr:hypothetical protein [Terriglobales bacterium]